MPGILKVYTLDKAGVNVDKNPLQLADNELRASQNMTGDSLSGHDGSLRVRAGLAKFNQVPAPGPILGGILMPVAQTGGAPVSTGGGGGGAGDAGGTGSAPPGTPGPGGSTGGVSGSVGAVGVFNSGSTTLFNGKKRLIAVGRSDFTVSDQTGEGWYLTTKGIADASVRLTSPGPPGAASSTISNPAEQLIGYGVARYGVVIDGVMYYAKASSGTTRQGIAPSVRRTDGISDSQFATFANNPAISATDRIIATMCSTPDGLIYVSINHTNVNGESETSNAAIESSIGVIDPARGAISDSTIGTIMPVCLAQYLGRIYMGGSFSDGTMRNGIIAALTLPSTLVIESTSTRPFYRCTSLCVYRGRLYAGFEMLAFTGHAILFASIFSRGADDAAGWGSELTATGSFAAQPHNAFISMVVFNDKLYASFYSNNADAKIYQFDGTTWTAVFTNGGAGDRTPLSLWVDQDTIYAFGLSSSSSVKIYSSTTGTSWADQSANLVSLTAGNERPIAALFGFDQS